jgi:nickel-dependent lactate racemase
VILDAQKRFLRIFAGHWLESHLQACKFVEQVYGVPVAREADIVIASCGGYPKDINVYQLQKTMDNAWCAVREGGVVIILGECEEGSGSAALERALEENPSPDAIKEALEKDFRIGANKAFAITRLMKKARFILVSALDKRLAKKLLFDAVDTPEEALKLAESYVGSDYKILLMPQGSLTVPIPQK